MKSARRKFLNQISALTLASSPMLSLLTGCTSAGLTMYRTVVLENRIRISIREVPDLQSPGGAIRISAEEVLFPIILTRTGENDFSAVSTICTHLGCIVRKDGNYFRCPCHGSTYSLEGAVVRGPAENSLKTFKTEYSGDDLVVIL